MTSWKQQFIFGIEKLGDDTSWESSGFGAWTGFWSDGDGKSLNTGCGVRNEEYEYTECNTYASLQSSNIVRLESQAGIQSNEGSPAGKLPSRSCLSGMALPTRAIVAHARKKRTDANATALFDLHQSNITYSDSNTGAFSATEI